MLGWGLLVRKEGRARDYEREGHGRVRPRWLTTQRTVGKWQVPGRAGTPADGWYRLADAGGPHPEQGAPAAWGTERTSCETRSRGPAARRG